MGIKGTGQEIEFGIIKSTTWHTAVALAAGSKMKIDSVGPLRRQQEILQDTQMGRDWARRTDLGRINQELNFAGPLRYENSHFTHLVQLIGTELGSVAGIVYTHQVDIDEEIDGVFYTAAGLIRHSTLGDSEIFEWPSVKPVGWELSVGEGGFMQFSGSGIADTFITTDEGITNTTTTIGTTSTYNTEALRVPFGHCRFNINAQNGADFNASGEGTDRLFPIGVTLSVTRPIERDFDANRLAADSGDADAYKTSEPSQNGRFWEILLTLEFAETDSDVWMDRIRSNTALKGELYFYSTANRNIKFQFPNLLVSDLSVDPSGLGKIPHTVVLQACQVSDGSSAPAGMAGILKPMRLTIINSHDYTYDTNTLII